MKSLTYKQKRPDMNSLFEMREHHNKAYKNYTAKQKKLEAKKAEIEKQLNNMRYPHLTNYLKKLGKAALPLIKGAVDFEVYGPFGLSNECSIYFHAKQKRGQKEPKTLAGATFRYSGDGFCLKDYSKKTGEYPENSIGAVNGFNYKDLPITEKMTLEWFVKFAKKGWNKK